MNMAHRRAVPQCSEHTVRTTLRIRTYACASLCECGALTMRRLEGGLFRRLASLGSLSSAS